jgi:CHAD domain-containing protein
MIKTRGLNGTAAVTFTLPAAVAALTVAICGEWNNWSPYLDVMERVDEGFRLTLGLEVGRRYRYRYLLDGNRWENDWGADAYVPNGHGSEDSVVDLTDLPEVVPPPPVDGAPLLATASMPHTVAVADSRPRRAPEPAQPEPVNQPDPLPTEPVTVPPLAHPDSWQRASVDTSVVALSDGAVVTALAHQAGANGGTPAASTMQATDAVNEDAGPETSARNGRASSDAEIASVVDASVGDPDDVDQPEPAPAPAAVHNLEQEAKLLAPAGLSIPDLSDLVPDGTAVSRPVERLDATYYDTVDLRLARSGVTLRHRGGESGPAWTVKFPESENDATLARREIRFGGPPGQVPNPAADLVLATSRARALEPVARLTTVRRPLEFRDADGQLLAELVDDTVSFSGDRCRAGRFREIEIELHHSGNGSHRLLKTAVKRLVAAGAEKGAPQAKLVRALGDAAIASPDIIVPDLAKHPDLIEVMHHALAASVAQLVHHDPGARLGDDEEDVHKLRVATRRLRSDLRSFEPLLRAARVDPVRTELKWLGGVIGTVRDTDVLGARLRELAAGEPSLDAAGVSALLAHLDAQAEAARAAMLTTLRDARYMVLLDTLVALAAAPPLAKHSKLAERSSRQGAARIARTPWRHLAVAVANLPAVPSDPALHRVRILAKRTRYAAEAIAPVIGSDADRFASRVEDLQTILGDHQDTVFAEAWLRDAAAANPVGRDAACRLIALEQSRRVELRGEWPRVWKRASRKKVRAWF